MKLCVASVLAYAVITVLTGGGTQVSVVPTQSAPPQAAGLGAELGGELLPASVWGGNGVGLADVAVVRLPSACGRAWQLVADHVREHPGTAHSALC